MAAKHKNHKLLCHKCASIIGSGVDIAVNNDNVMSVTVDGKPVKRLRAIPFDKFKCNKCEQFCIVVYVITKGEEDDS